MGGMDQVVKARCEILCVHLNHFVKLVEVMKDEYDSLVDCCAVRRALEDLRREVAVCLELFTDEKTLSA